MPVKDIKLKGLKWIDAYNLKNDKLLGILKKFDFHELDVEACLEKNQRCRVDFYDDYIFLILYFPKYNRKTKTYLLNEFNIFIGKDFVISIKDYQTQYIDQLVEKYSNIKVDKDEKFKISSGFIAYEIVENMLEKIFKLLYNVRKDLMGIEGTLFESPSQALVKEIMIKNRNTVTLKHMFKPQITVLKSLELRINQMFDGVMEVYFEDLIDKLEQIVIEIERLEESIDSIENALKTMIDMRTNNIIQVLTVFSAFLLPLTLITSFYGMNITLPFENNNFIVFGIIFISSLIMRLVLKFFIFDKKF